MTDELRAHFIETRFPSNALNTIYNQKSIHLLWVIQFQIMHSAYAYDKDQMFMKGF